jgi:hypothetical protein
MIPVQVECYSGHTYAQEPRSLQWRGFHAQVERVERAWRTPEGPAFRVRLAGGLSLHLLYVESSDQWLIGEQAPDSIGE